MPSDYKETASPTEIGEATAVSPTDAGLSDAGIQAMQGEADVEAEAQSESTETVDIPPPPEPATAEAEETPEAEQTCDEGAGLSEVGIQAMQGETNVSPEPQSEPAEVADASPLPEPKATPSPEPPPEHEPRPAIGERGQAERIESGAEKGEKEVFHGRGPERLG
jgi:hypothetical protein